MRVRAALKGGGKYLTWPDGDPWLDVYDYGWYAERYKWTPAQVDELPLWVAQRLPAFADAWDEVLDEKQREANA